MPSPFPGIDPYLEVPHLWHGIHKGMIYEIYRAINRLLPPGFIAIYEERIVLLPSEQNIFPDTGIARIINAPQSTGSSQTAILDNPKDHGRVKVQWDEFREGYIEIVTTDKRAKVVTVIEVLSPSNKKAGRDRIQYLQKQQAVLYSETSLLEIDLLSKGRHTVAIPLRQLRQLGKGDGVVSLHRAYEPQEFEYWFCRMSEPLPVISIPLTQNLPEIPCDIQTIYQGLYDDGNYARRLDYSQPPPIPVSEEQSAWMDTLLREKGLRT